jgi:predicted aspartyl protease
MLLGGKNFTVSAYVSRNGLSFSLSALVDSGANGYIFINHSVALQVAKRCYTYVVPLNIPGKVRGYDGKSEALITHAIILHLQIDRHRQMDVPMLITNLGHHDLILGRGWLEIMDI